ncbi:MAG: hypothetical protein ABIO50_04215 [Nitrosospira sp.]
MPSKNNAVAQELFDLIGDEAATRLCLVFGGTRLAIGGGSTSRQRLGVIVGEELAEKLIYHYRDTTLDVPKLSRQEKERRNNDVVADIEAGMAQRSVAMKYEITTRQVRNISAAALAKYKR